MPEGFRQEGNQRKDLERKWVWKDPRDQRSKNHILSCTRRHHHTLFCFFSPRFYNSVPGWRFLAGLVSEGRIERDLLWEPGERSTDHKATSWEKPLKSVSHKTPLGCHLNQRKSHCQGQACGSLGSLVWCRCLQETPLLKGVRRNTHQRGGPGRVMFEPSIIFVSQTAVFVKKVIKLKDQKNRVWKKKSSQITGLQFSDSGGRNSLDVPRKLLLNSSTGSLLGNWMFFKFTSPKVTPKDTDSHLLLGSFQLGR